MNQLGLNIENKEQLVRQTMSAIVACPDCSRPISYRAEHCPSCGVRLQVTGVTQPSVARIALGVIVGYFGIMVINFIVLVVFMMFFAGMMVSVLDGLRAAPTESPRSR